MNRDDLRVRFMARIKNSEGAGSLFEHHRPVTDAELTKMGLFPLAKMFDPVVFRQWAADNGYVKLDGIDVEVLRAEAANWRPISDAAAPAGIVLIRLVLAALDQEPQ